MLGVVGRAELLQSRKAGSFVVTLGQVFDCERAANELHASQASTSSTTSPCTPRTSAGLGPERWGPRQLQPATQPRRRFQFIGVARWPFRWIGRPGSKLGSGGRAAALAGSPGAGPAFVGSREAWRECDAVAAACHDLQRVGHGVLRLCRVRRGIGRHAHPRSREEQVRKSARRAARQVAAPAGHLPCRGCLLRLAPKSPRFRLARHCGGKPHSLRGSCCGRGRELRHLRKPGVLEAGRVNLLPPGCTCGL